MGKRIDFEAVRVERLAEEIAEAMKANHRHLITSVPEPDVDLWRKAARRAGRLLGWSVRTGTGDTSEGMTRVWVVDNRHDDELNLRERRDDELAMREAVHKMGAMFHSPTPRD